MKITAFAASSSRNSINKLLVKHACDLLVEQIVPTAQVEILDMNNFEMPIYSIDREQGDGIPDAAHRFFEAIGKADALIISYAEHNGVYTAAFKNVFDWASRIEMKVYQGKPAVFLSASVGKRGGSNVLTIATESAPHFGADVKASVAVGRFGDVFDSEVGRLRDGEAAGSIMAALRTLP